MTVLTFSRRNGLGVGVIDRQTAAWPVWSRQPVSF